GARIGDVRGLDLGLNGICVDKSGGARTVVPLYGRVRGEIRATDGDREIGGAGHGAGGRKRTECGRLGGRSDEASGGRENLIAAARIGEHADAVTAGALDVLRSELCSQLCGTD